MPLWLDALAIMAFAYWALKAHIPLVCLFQVEEKEDFDSSWNGLTPRDRGENMWDQIDRVKQTRCITKSVGMENVLNKHPFNLYINKICILENIC